MTPQEKPASTLIDVWTIELTKYSFRDRIGDDYTFLLGMDGNLILYTWLEGQTCLRFWWSPTNAEGLPSFAHWIAGLSTDYVIGKFKQGKQQMGRTKGDDKHFWMRIEGYVDSFLAHLKQELAKQTVASQQVTLPLN